MLPLSAFSCCMISCSRQCRASTLLEPGRPARVQAVRPRHRYARDPGCGGLQLPSVHRYRNPGSYGGTRHPVILTDLCIRVICPLNTIPVADRMRIRLVASLRHPTRVGSCAHEGPCPRSGDTLQTCRTLLHLYPTVPFAETCCPECFHGVHRCWCGRSRRSF